MPSSIDVIAVDPGPGNKTTEKVKFDYLNKPLVCSGCCSLGHVVAACPKVTRVWVRKFANTDGQQQIGDELKLQTGEQKLSSHNVEQVDAAGNVEIPTSKSEDSPEVWTEVRTKRKTVNTNSPVSVSPPLPNSFQNLVNVDEVDLKMGKKLSKSARKKAKKALGASPAPQS